MPNTVIPSLLLKFRFLHVFRRSNSTLSVFSTTSVKRSVCFDESFVNFEKHWTAPRKNFSLSSVWVVSNLQFLRFPAYLVSSCVLIYDDRSKISLFSLKVKKTHFVKIYLSLKTLCKFCDLWSMIFLSFYSNSHQTIRYFLIFWWKMTRSSFWLKLYTVFFLPITADS